MFTETLGGSFNLAINPTIKLIQDILRKDAGVDGDAQRINQLAWLVFLKILDERVTEGDNANEEYSSPIPERLRWRNWTSRNNPMTGDELIDFVNNDLLKTLKTLPYENKTSIQFVIRSIFQDTLNYMKSGNLLRQVVDKINDFIDLKTAKQRHLFGEIYEKILSDLQNAGNAGEFYTPRAVTEFMVKMINPKLTEKVLDPACGTGGFLTSSIEHIRQNWVKTKIQEKKIQGCVLGVEKKALPHLLCVTNMLLHGIDVPYQFFRENTLSDSLIKIISPNSIDVIISNPPFGGIEEEININLLKDIRTKETADLFVALSIHLLKKSGRAAIVLHDGFLKGEGVKTRIKEKLVNQCNLHTIVRLPIGVFSPYTNITTNILFFEKGKKTKEIWYYEHKLPEGYKSYSKTKPITIEDLNSLMSWWNARETNEFAWKVSLQDVVENNFNLDFKNPHKFSKLFDDPHKLLKTYNECISSIEQTSKLLKQELSSSINNESKVNNLFFDNFNLITNSIYGIQSLRKLILQLAMQGRLVLQNEDEGNANSILEFIEKKTNGIKTPQSINFSKIPFSIPKSWVWTSLGNIGQIIGGGTPKTNNPDFFSENGIPWLTPSDLYKLKEKFISRGKRDISPIGLVKSSARLLPAGSVLFSCRAPIGYVAIAANELATNQGFKSCVPHIMEMNEFIYYYLMSAAEEIDQNASGATFKEISGKVVQQILTPLPPLKEQKRIVAKLDLLMKLLDELELSFNPQKNAHEDLIAGLTNQVVVRHLSASK